MSTEIDNAHAHHAIDYIEIAVTDIEAAKAFYATAFGWSLVDYGPDYAGIQVEGKEAGGLRRDSEVRAGGPLVILYSEDLEQTVEAVEGAGGTIVRPIYAFPGGRRFHFADPAGNELAGASGRIEDAVQERSPRASGAGSPAQGRVS
jgi:predicted enzyme related to lactoylglutathione lyase